MPDFPLHPTLFFSLSCFIGLLLGWLFYLSDSITENNNLKYATLFLQSTWAIAAFFTIYLFILLSQDHSKAIEGINSVFGYIQYLETQKNSINAQSLAPLGMMIAALIASASVMKNIAETKANENKKHDKEDSKFYLEKCVAYLKEVDELLGKLQNDKLSWGHAAVTLLSMREISQSTYITDPTHQKIFAIEYTNAKLKLLRSMINMSVDKQADAIKPAFFCSVSDWKSKNLEEAFAIDSYKMDPKRIIAVMKYLQLENNNFLNEAGDYSDWRTCDLNQFMNVTPMNLAIGYIKMYKEKIPEKIKDQQ